MIRQRYDTGGDAPIAAWRARAKLRFPPRQLCRPRLSTEDTCVSVKIKTTTTTTKAKNIKN